MNKPQLICLWVGIVCFVLAGLVPPWVEVYDDGEMRTSQAIGHASLFEPPEADFPDTGVKVDYGRLGLTWAIIAGVTAGAIWSYRNWRPTPPVRGPGASPPSR